MQVKPSACEAAEKENKMKTIAVKRYFMIVNFNDAKVFIKPHPRDKLDYKSLYPDIPQFGARVPMEILNLMEGAHFDTVISIFTELDAITFADEKLRLAEDFMDKYENPKIHRHNDNI